MDENTKRRQYICDMKTGSLLPKAYKITIPIGFSFLAVKVTDLKVSRGGHHILVAV